MTSTSTLGLKPSLGRRNRDFIIAGKKKSKFWACSVSTNTWSQVEIIEYIEKHLGLCIKFQLALENCLREWEGLCRQKQCTALLQNFPCEREKLDFHLREVWRQIYKILIKFHLQNWYPGVNGTLRWEFCFGHKENPRLRKKKGWKWKNKSRPYPRSRVQGWNGERGGGCLARPDTKRQGRGGLETRGKNMRGGIRGFVVTSA